MIRSALFIPALNAKAIGKARGLACDAVILELEDAIAPERKAEAREAMVREVREGGFRARTLVVRVNGSDTAWNADDLAAVAACRPDAVLLPKVSDAGAIAAARKAVGEGIAVWAMVETCMAILRLAEIAAAPTLQALVAGTNDLAKEMRCDPGTDRAALIPTLSQIVIAARAHGLVAIDGVSNAIEDAERLEAECRQGRRLGFDGKSLIHPAQLEIANRAFSPSEAEVARAREIVEAFAAPSAEGAGAIRLGNEMIERLHLTEAERMIALAERA